jgi:hypothetical protein
MGVLKKGFLFLGFAVSLYPVFVGLLTVPWLQRQCVFAFFLFSSFVPLLALFHILGFVFFFLVALGIRFDRCLTYVNQTAHSMLTRSTLASGMMSTSPNPLALQLTK